MPTTLATKIAAAAVAATHIAGALACEAQRGGRVVAPRGTTTHSVAYVNGGHPRQVLDLYIPRTAERPIPVIIVIHGGAWTGGDKAENPQVAWGVPLLLNAGYAVASINHRYSQQAAFPAQMHDAKAAVRWVKKHAAEYGLDSSRVGAWGTSSGGHLAALLGTSAGVAAMDGTLVDTTISTRVRAVVTWFAPTDFLQMDSQRLADGMVHDGRGSPESRLIGGPLQERKDAARAASPNTYATRDDASFLIFHGDQDRAVPYQQGELLRNALRDAGVAVELRILRGAGHGSPEFRASSVSKAMVDFFNKHLRGK